MDPILFLSDLIARLGYLGVAIAMFVESFFPPIPSEAILPFAGFAAAQGKLSFVGVLIAATAGSLLGAAGLYGFGRLVSESRLQKLIERWGRPIGIRHADMLKAQGWFNLHGHKAVFFGRMIPGVRTIISIPAGVNRMSFLPFILWSGMGTAVWSILLIAAGYMLGNRYHQVVVYIEPLSKIVLGLVVLGLAWLIVRRKLKLRDPV